MTTIGNWTKLSFDEAKVLLLAEIFPTRETTKSGREANAGVKVPGGSDTNRGEAGGA